MRFSSTQAAILLHESAWGEFFSGCLGRANVTVTLENSNQNQMLATDPPSTRKFEPVMNVA
jgi:hypothetical protein